MRWGDRYHTGETHWAVDLGTQYGEPIRAMASGRVIVARRDPENPWMIIQYDGSDRVQVKYYHIKDVRVNRGDRVKQGDIVARVGLTGRGTPSDPRSRPGYPHLHLEAWKNEVMIDPLTLDMTCPGQGGRYWWPVGC